MNTFSRLLSFGGQIRRGEKYVWSSEASQVSIIIDKHLIRSKELSSGTELNRFDEVGEAALGKSSGKKSDIIREESPRLDM